MLVESCLTKYYILHKSCSQKDRSI